MKSPKSNRILKNGKSAKNKQTKKTKQKTENPHIAPLFVFLTLGQLYRNYRTISIIACTNGSVSLLSADNHTTTVQTVIY